MDFFKSFLVALAFVGITPASAFTLAGSSGLIGWNRDQITFLVNYEHCSISRARVEAAIDAAAALWNSVSTIRITVARGEAVTTSAGAIANGDSSSGPATPSIVCDNAMSTTIGADASRIPASTLIRAPKLQIDYGFILLNSESGKAANIANISDSKLAVIIAHEMGHILGLGHSENVAALMYFDATYKEELSLSQDDMDGVTYLYPRTEGGGGAMFGCGTISAGSGGGPTSGGPQAMTEMFALLAACAYITQVLKHRTRLRMIS